MMNDIDEYNIDEDMAIDKHRLDEEWVNHPRIYMKYVRLVAEAKKEVSQCHERVKVMRSRLVKKCKEEDPKATGPQIEAYYRTNKLHMNAKKRMIEAEYNYDILSQTIYLLGQRKAGLQDLVSLWFGEYFSSPKSPDDLGIDKALKEQVTDNKVKRSKMGRRRSRRTKTN
jgi:hypothetical protein